MKKMYIPKGTTEKHENIYTDELVVKGRLIVTGVIKAKSIYGDGTIEAEKITANTIVADTLDVSCICTKRVIANKIFCVTATASIGVIAKDYIEAYSIKTPRLTSTHSHVEKVEANEIIHLQPKGSLLAAIICSWAYEHFAFWRHNRITKRNSMSSDTELTPKKPADIEFENIIKEYRAKYQEGGYRLVLEAEEPGLKVI